MAESTIPGGFEGGCPILRVQSVAASIDYYLQQLGFKIDWRTQLFASVSRGKCHIFLAEGDQGHPGAWVWIGVEDAESLFEEYRARRAKIRHPPTNYLWAYEMQVEDLDGNVLRLGSDSREDRPLGEWLDMHGRRWALVDGEWERVSE
jgi:Glyoxalase/Bleomycin resistance protein/Dioxygenase superfamily